MYEIFEHTADFGLRMESESLEGVFAESARALFALMLTDPTQVRAADSVDVSVDRERGDSFDNLLHDWLSELLYLFHTRRMAFTDFEVEIDDDCVRGTARGEPLDPKRHHVEVEVKAITYHGLKVEQIPQGWMAEVIVDI
ncbi:MAG: archease [Planctomycetota bacterium]